MFLADADQKVDIKSNTATAVTFASDGCTPDATSAYEIRQIWTVDGIHPRANGHVAMSVPMTERGVIDSRIEAIRQSSSLAVSKSRTTVQNEQAVQCTN